MGLPKVLEQNLSFLAPIQTKPKKMNKLSIKSDKANYPKIPQATNQVQGPSVSRPRSLLMGDEVLEITEVTTEEESEE
ncbi:CFF_collapsed_G0043380.mRNA.1.CDS.1 [Saccharomyces cerevisiae]|nr:CFF_collapsed_G0043380.mRNA.1.CDS.1 [Saccharomyces cerevisiae]